MGTFAMTFFNIQEEEEKEEEKHAPQRTRRAQRRRRNSQGSPRRLFFPPFTLLFSVLSVVRSFSVFVFVVVFSLCVLCGLRGERGFALGPSAGPERRASFA
jgi:hypothetical protein